ncbi:hypothetical protein MBLNU457_g0165t1 [Dothideomycetes sp. NU457]
MSRMQSSSSSTSVHSETVYDDKDLHHKSEHRPSTFSDAEHQLELEEEDDPEIEHSQPAPDAAAEKNQLRPQLTRQSTNDGKELVCFSRDDPDNAHNWSNRKKNFVVFVGVMLVMNSTIGSSIASGTPVEVSNYFHNYNQEQLVLPTSIYLVGYVLGPLLFGPLSESFGRRWVLIATFALFTVFTMACALAPTFAAYIVFRFIVGIGASSPISVVGGVYADVYADPVTRGRALTIFMTATTWGPLIGPIVSGFVGQSLGWRWTYWIALIIAGANWPILIAMPETYGPIILKRRAQRLRKKENNPNIVAPIELEKTDIRALMTTVLTRPVRMIMYEAIVLCSCLYLAYAYAIFYIFFEAFPIIFIDTYGFNYGEEGLTFLPVGIGAIIACGIYLWWDAYLQKAKSRNAPWSRKEEYRRLPLACLGGPLFVVSLFWIGWTARPDIHWIVPVLAALPFGMGFLLLFMALLNYLVDAYEIFAASATAASSSSRSLFGALLPFAAKPMYDTLGVPWACSLLGFLSLVMCAIPFVFIRYGDRIRANSKFCQELRAKKEEMEESRKRNEARVERQERRKMELKEAEQMV